MKSTGARGPDWGAELRETDNNTRTRSMLSYVRPGLESSFESALEKEVEHDEKKKDGGKTYTDTVCNIAVNWHGSYTQTGMLKFQFSAADSSA